MISLCDIRPTKCGLEGGAIILDHFIKLNDLFEFAILKGVI
jgi:hypothetical protein